MCAPTYEVKSDKSTTTGLSEYDVWKHDNGGSQLIASYPFEHQAEEVAAVLNAWAAQEV
jgi:hypothetical protein